MIPQIDPISWGIASFWGALLGVLYFGGLWWTLRNVTGKANGRLLLGLSFLLRTAMALFGFYIVVQRDVQAFFFTIGCFFGVRLIMVRALGPSEGKKGDANQSG